jgi:DNA polymerase elongation subunit (family B)
MLAVNAWTKKDKVIICHRDTNGRLQYDEAPAEYTAHVKVLPKGLMNDSRVIRSQEMPDGYHRIYYRDYQSRLEWREVNPTVEVWEADVSPVKRLLADRDIIIQPPIRVFWDIETDSRVPFERKEEARILSWAMTDTQGRVTSSVLSHFSDDAEKRLLNEFLEALADYDQVAAWNGDEFDFLVKDARMKLLRVWPDRRILWIDQMAAFRKMNIQVAGGGDEKQSTSLNAIAKALLGDKKTEDFNSGKTYEAWRDDRNRLVEYNIHDTELQRGIEAKTGYLDALQTICEVCHIFPNEYAISPMTQHDGWFLRKAREMGTHLPSKVEREETPQFEGAFVRPPTVTGIIKEVSVVDFAGLYPSILQTWNMDHATKHPFGTCEAPGTGIRFNTDVTGMIPMALTEFKKLRDVWKDKKKKAVPHSEEWKTADRVQNVYKVLMNSLYGILGSIYSRFFDVEIAESVTLAGQWLIKQVEDQVRVRGWEVIYTDTDGCQFRGASDAEAGEFAKWFSDVFIPERLREWGCVTNTVRLDYQERFSRVIFPVGKDGLPSSKRYCARFSVWDGKPVTERAIEVKGLEVKRGDTSRLARRMQQEIIDLLMDEHEDDMEFESLVQRWRHRVTIEHVDVNDIAISKSIKDLDGYAVRKKLDGSVMNQPAHVEVAKRLRERGEDVSQGTRVSYIIVDADESPQVVIPVQDYTGEFDRRHTWNGTVYPASMRLLIAAFPNRNWKHHIIKKPKKPLKGQLGLGI